MSYKAENNPKCINHEQEQQMEYQKSQSTTSRRIYASNNTGSAFKKPKLKVT